MEANQPRMRRTEGLPTVQKARRGTACGRGWSLMFPGSGAHPACMHPHHPGGLWPLPWQAGVSPAQTLQTSGRASRLGSCHRQCVWNQLDLGTGDPSLDTLPALGNTPFQPASRAGFLMWGPRWACPCYVKSTCAGRIHTKSLKTHTLRRPQGDFKASKKCQGLLLCCPFLPRGEGRPWVLLQPPQLKLPDEESSLMI